MSAHAPSRFAALRKRKAQGGSVAPHRSAAELQRLAALPLSERSAAEKEAVRNARKREKWKEKKAAAAVAAASLPVLHIPSPPPPTRSSSPQRQASAALASAAALALPAPSAVRHDSLLHTVDLEDILWRSLSPPTAPVAAVASSAAAALPCLPLRLPSPPPASVSPLPLFDESYHPSPSLPAAAAAASPATVAPPIPPAPATSAAAASAMSSASKLRSSILKKRAVMSKLLPVPQRAAARTADERLRTLQERKQVEEDDSIDDENSARIEVDVWKQREKLAQIVSTATADENAAWASAEKTFADSIIGVVAREVKRRRGDHCAGISSSKADTIQANVHTWASTARLQGKCTGTADTHAHAPHGLCPGPFSPSTFFLHGVVQFAHWKDHKRNNDPCQLIRNRCRADDNDSFVKWLAANGRFLYACCHAIESARESRIPSIPP